VLAASVLKPRITFVFGLCPNQAIKIGDLGYQMAAHDWSEVEKSPGADKAAEIALIDRVLNGDKEAFYELIQPCERSVFLMAYSIMRDEAEAEDIAQEAILKAFRSLRDFRGESKFSSWLLVITRNEGYMRKRRQHREIWESLDERQNDEDADYEPVEFGDWREIPSEALERKEMRDVIEKAMNSLSEIYREVLFLRDIQQLSVAEAAKILGVSEGLVKTRLMRARLRLRDLVAPMTTTRGILSRNPFRKSTKPWF
jgi:RNA polymerase sigma-70 factor, ECF subfamily